MLFREFPGARVTQRQWDQFQGSWRLDRPIQFQSGILVDKNAKFHRPNRHNSFEHNWRGTAARCSIVNASQCGGATVAGRLGIVGLQTAFVAALFCIAAMNGLAAAHKPDHNIGTEIC
jgi:hypothetical protein